MKYKKILLLLITLFILKSIDAFAMGKKFSEQGTKLTAAMNKTLLLKGFCKSPRECYDLLPGMLETDNIVLIHFFEVNEKNYPAFLAVVDFSLTDGMQITNGVPITIRAFHESHEKYRESGIFIKGVKPFVIMEIMK